MPYQKRIGPRLRAARTSSEWVEQYLAEQERLGNILPDGQMHPDSAANPAAQQRALESDPRRGDEIIALIKRAWDERIGPMVMKDPDELASRLARRRGGMMNRPPRAWCIAIRAADTRLEEYVGTRKAGDRELCGEVYADYQRHAVQFNAQMLRRLCTPVLPGGGYWTVPQLMKELGCSLHNIRYMIEKGIVRKSGIPGLGGKSGWPVPVLSVLRPLDPGSRLREHADVVWGTMWRHVRDNIPDDLTATIERVPSSVYVTPALHSFSEGDVFTGWKWVCPGCGKTCRTIFYPLPPMSWVQLMKEELHDSDPSHPDALGKGNQTFACMRCHEVMYFSRLDAKTWNRLVSHLSAGLVYGKEVTRPSWYVAERKRKFRPKLMRAPSMRREQVKEMLLEGKGVTQIARELGLSKSTVGSRAGELYRAARVKGVEEFRRKMGCGTRKTISDDGLSCSAMPQTEASDGGAGDLWNKFGMIPARAGFLVG